MRSPEFPQTLVDTNGREIKPSLIGRLSDQGKEEAIMPWMGPETKELPNFRFKILEVRPSAIAVPIVAQSIEMNGEQVTFHLRPEWIVIENE